MSTFVLVHDAWHDAQAWSRVVPLLGAAGHTSFAPSLTGHGGARHLLAPGVGLETHVEDVVALLEGEDLRDVVLVGHGYAGLVITDVVERVPDRVAQMVHLDAMIPDQGEGAVDIDAPTRDLVQRAAAAGRPWRVPPPPRDPDGWFGVVDPADLRWLATFVGDESALCFQQPVRLRWSGRWTPATTA